MFNETLTRCTLDDPRYARTLRLIRKWTHEDRLLPSLADRESFAAEQGYGGATLQLFNKGHYGMIRLGRFALIQLRKFGQLDLAVSEYPHDGFPNARIRTRCAALYVDGQPELAKYFLAFLTSEQYNMQIVRDADALPPNPQYTDTTLFKRPPNHPNEWGLHEVFSQTARQIAIATSRTPYAPEAAVERLFQEATDAVLVGRVTAQQTAESVTRAINDEIARTLREDAQLRKRYEAARERQQQIDDLRAAGKPVPLQLIDNPFHRRYYQEQGWTR
jgi:multiple sugar transport system substrate-binding protein